MNAILWRIMFAGVALLSPLADTVAAAPPQIEVEFVMDPLPATLALEDPQSDMAIRIADTLREETVELLNHEFPFIEWIPPLTPDADPVRWLTLTLRADDTIGRRVHIDSSVLDREGLDKELDVAVVDVYPDGFTAPTLSEVEAVTVYNARHALKVSIHENSDRWQQQLTGNIILSRQIVPRASDSVIILPVAAQRLSAHPESVLSVVFRSKVGEQREHRGKIELSPLEPVWDLDDEFVGMQTCLVTFYQYSSIRVQEWHTHILEAVANLVPVPTLTVRMKRYKREDREEYIVDDYYSN